jgi:hypothetical protein
MFLSVEKYLPETYSDHKYFEEILDTMEIEIKDEEILDTMKQSFSDTAISSDSD